ncbi:MAG: formate/nitrite transporter family protein [Cyclobacteriaceae bacterium]
MTYLREFFKKPARKVDDISNYPKSAEEIFHEQVQTGLAEHRRSPGGLLVSAIAAGLEVGFTLFLTGIVLTLFFDEADSSIFQVWLALSYPIGFVFVVIGRSELFTEHTTLAVIPVLNGSTNFLSLMKTWGLVFAGNLFGGYLMSFILTRIGPPMDIISIEAFNYLAHKMVDYSWDLMLGSSIIAGWLMGLLSWLVTSSQETISRIVMVILVTFLIGMGGLHHSIVGSIEVFAGVLTGGISLGDYMHFQWWTTLGNIIGGVVFVSLIKFSTIRLSEQENTNRD